MTNPEALTPEEVDWLPLVRLAQHRGRPADIDDTRRLLDIIDRLDRSLRAARQTPDTSGHDDEYDAPADAEHAAIHGAASPNGWTHKVAAFDEVLSVIDETEEMS